MYGDSGCGDSGSSPGTACVKTQQLQSEFTAHLRAPDRVPAPRSVENRRMEIYRDLIYNNIESFIASGFPVIRSLYSGPRWHAMVRDFVSRHASSSPYFLEISEEFLQYLQNERSDSEEAVNDPLFLLELAHYEWVELALDVSTESFPESLTLPAKSEQFLDLCPVVSPLAWSLSYQYPVHRIGPTYQPVDPPHAPTFLVVYRNRADKVAFLEANGVTARLLQLADAQRSNEIGTESNAPGRPSTARELLLQLAQELQHPEPTQLLQSGVNLLQKLMRLEIIAGFRQPVP
ncbi:HvfC family RiPP maturation protein [Microbulbifer celer]|uniref:DUF2063 domain-containing protein n=1 Tax=Microbulbifer celer TaxID=435905 RepID=A0ABW3U3X9_9GAMM|nr:putative DNA-binding domain-containing protein [Microbulbifer celer]UFN57796.1 putative DNA-binding domain-containing protein [Microbulbifer celer]